MWVKGLSKVTGVATWSIIPASTKELEPKKKSFCTWSFEPDRTLGNYQRRFVWIDRNQYEHVHAHDWVTKDCTMAEALAKKKKIRGGHRSSATRMVQTVGEMINAFKAKPT